MQLVIQIAIGASGRYVYLYMTYLYFIDGLIWGVRNAFFFVLCERWLFEVFFLQWFAYFFGSGRLLSVFKFEHI